MKPDWKDAPKWAQWLAMDKNGGWFWYRVKPDCDLTHCWSTGLKVDYDEAKYCDPKGVDWTTTLERRPA